jgi:hypothetical protein
MHCAPNLILNSIARVYANKLTLIQRLVHSNSRYGENLYYTVSSQTIDITSINGMHYSKKRLVVY